jgi:hypothetical protein
MIPSNRIVGDARCLKLGDMSANEGVLEIVSDPVPKWPVWRLPHASLIPGSPVR